MHAGCVFVCVHVPVHKHASVCVSMSTCAQVCGGKHQVAKIHSSKHALDVLKLSHGRLRGLRD